MARDGAAVRRCGDVAPVPPDGGCGADGRVRCRPLAGAVRMVRMLRCRPLAGAVRRPPVREADPARALERLRGCAD